MDTNAIFGLQFILSLIMWGVIAKWYWSPKLNRLNAKDALLALSIVHAFRYIGMVFFVPGVVSEQLPETFAKFAGYGDLATALIAMIAIFALRYKWNGSLALVWTFNIFGTLDLLNALSNQGVVPYLHVAWFIPTLLVPLLLVTHFMIFARLLRKESRDNIARSGIVS